MKYTSIIILFILVLGFVPSVYAQDEDIDVSALPQELSERLNIPLFAAELLMSGIFLALFLFPTLLLTRNYMAHLVMGLTTMGFCIAMGWLPIWILLVIVIMIAMLFSGKIREWITGGLGGG